MPTRFSYPITFVRISFTIFMLSHSPCYAWLPYFVHKVQVTPHHTRLRIHKANILRICDRSNLDLLQKEGKMKRWRRWHHQHKQQGIILVRSCRVHKRQRKFIHIRYNNLYAWRSRKSNNSSIVSRPRVIAIVAAPTTSTTTQIDWW